LLREAFQRSLRVTRSCALRTGTLLLEIMTDWQVKTPDPERQRTPPTRAADDTKLTMSCVLCSTPYPEGTHYCPIDGAIVRPTASPQDDLIGTVLDGRYHLVRKIGQGGMGDVYLGEHVRTQRHSAVKVVSRSRATDPAALGRFLREATNAGRISHPQVATVYDFGETPDGIAYIAMEYVDGEPLSALLQRDGALPASRAVAIARQVAEAVAAAHDLGIVHRDLKPGNILITTGRRGGDQVKVVDFGIARVNADEQQHLTRAGVVVGTPEYMSPEQILGEEVDGRSDIYSLGCVLYQMLTGEQAFSGSTARIITCRFTEPPPSPRNRYPATPRKLDAIVLRALARYPEERFQTMDALRDALADASQIPVTTGLRRLGMRLGLLAERRRSPGEAAAPQPGTHPGDTGSRRTQAGLESASTGPRVPAAPASTGQQSTVIAAADAYAASGMQPPKASEGAAGAETSVAPDADSPVERTPSDAAPPDTSNVAPPDTRTAPDAPHLPREPSLTEQRTTLAAPLLPRASSPDHAPLPGASTHSPTGDHTTGEHTAEHVGVPEPAGIDTGQHSTASQDVAGAARTTQEQATHVFDAEAEKPQRPHSRTRHALAGAGAAVAILVVAVTLLGRNDSAGEPEAPAEAAIESPPPPVLDEQVLADVRAALGDAAGDEDELQFTRAIQRLRDAQVQLAGVAAVFPGDQQVRLLGDSIAAQLSHVQTRCNVLREVEIRRRQTPPDCIVPEE
jgi:serine/threonine protein kinase